jgi:ribosomal protein S18 acetylase RimI-like enzyme
LSFDKRAFFKEILPSGRVKPLRRESLLCGMKRCFSRYRGRFGQDHLNNPSFVRTVMKTELCENRVWLLSEEAFSIYASCMYRPTYEAYQAQMEDYLRDSSVNVYTYEQQGRIAGMLVLMLSKTDAEIVGIAVSENARRKGIGKRLIRSVMASENLESVKAQTDDDSIAFYRKCGFSEQKTVVEYPDGSSVRYNCVLHK